MSQQKEPPPASGGFFSKPTLGNCCRIKSYNISHALRALRFEILRQEKQNTMRFLSEIALSANGLVAWRELFLIAGEVVGMANVVFVTTLSSRFYEWMNLCRETTRNAVDFSSADYRVNTSLSQLRPTLVSVAGQMVNTEKDLSSHDISRLVVYTSIGMLDPEAEALPIPEINGQKIWAEVLPGKPPNVLRAACALIHGIMRKDVLMSVHSAMLMSVWSYPDLVWKALEDYITLKRIQRYQSYVNDLFWIWCLFCHVDPDRSVVPRPSYWGRHRVFMTMAVRLLMEEPDVMPEHPPDFVMADSLLEKLFNPMITIKIDDIDEAHLPAPGKKDIQKVACASPDRTPQQAVRIAVQKLPTQSLDEYSQMLQKAMAVACARNPMDYGVRAQFEAHAGAYRHGLESSSALTFRVAGNPTAVRHTFAEHRPGIIDRVPGVELSSVCEIGQWTSYQDGEKKSEKYTAQIFPDVVFEWTAKVKMPSSVAPMHRNNFCLIKGPYRKPGAYRLFFLTARAHAELGMKTQWEMKALTFRDEHVLAFRPFWEYEEGLPDPLHWWELVDSDEVERMQILIFRFLLHRTMTGASFYFAHQTIYERDTNVPPNVGREQTPDADERFKPSGTWIVRNLGLIKTVMDSFLQRSLSPEIISGFPMMVPRLHWLKEHRDRPVEVAKRLVRFLLAKE